MKLLIYSFSLSLFAITADKGDIPGDTDPTPPSSSDEEDGSSDDDTDGLEEYHSCNEDDDGSDDESHTHGQSL